MVTCSAIDFQPRSAVRSNSNVSLHNGLNGLQVRNGVLLQQDITNAVTYTILNNFALKKTSDIPMANIKICIYSYFEKIFVISNNFLLNFKISIREYCKK